MNPNEELPAEVAPRAYFRQPVWKRLVVIGAGPAREPRPRVPHPRRAVLGDTATVEPTQPCRAGRARLARRRRCSQPGDRIVAVDGKRGRPRRSSPARSRATAARAARPTAARRRRPPRSRSSATASGSTVEVTPRYDARPSARASGSRFGGEPVDARARRRGRRERSTRCGTVTSATVGRDRAALLQPRGARRGQRRRRLVRDDAPARSRSTSSGRCSSSASSRCRSRSSTSSRSCRSTAATSSGRWPRRCAAGRSRSRSWSARRRRLRARSLLLFVIGLENDVDRICATGSSQVR